MATSFRPFRRALELMGKKKLTRDKVWVVLASPFEKGRTSYLVGVYTTEEKAREAKGDTARIMLPVELDRTIPEARDSGEGEA